MQHALTFSRLAAALGFCLFTAAACGGGDDDVAPREEDAGASSGSSSGGPGGSSGASSGGAEGGAPDAGPQVLTSVPVRLGIVASVTGQTATFTLRLYGADGYYQTDVNSRCDVPKVVDGCLFERCVEEPPPDAGAPLPSWTGFVNVVDETRPLTVRVDLAALARPRSEGLAIPIDLATASPGDVLHFTTENVTGFPPIDSRLALPSVAAATLASQSLSYAQGTPFTSPPAPGMLRFDAITTNGPDQYTASCFFDRTLGQNTFPALSLLGFPPCGGSGPYTVLPIGGARDIVTAPDGKQALVYVVTGDTASFQQGLACAP